MPQATNATISTKLREATRSEHAMAEKTALMSHIAHGCFSRELYCLLLSSLWIVYKGLENELQAGTSAVHSLLLPGIERADRIEQDLVFLCEDWPRPSPALTSLAYASHLKAISKDSPWRLGAHAYVRYLGDLYGGQMLGQIVARTLNLKDGRGVHFYDFREASEQCGGLDKLKAAFRRALDNLPLTEEQELQFLEEARTAFRLNIALFEDVWRLGQEMGFVSGKS